MSNSSDNWQLPPFTAEEFRHKSNEYCVCIFIINEGARFHAQLDRMKGLEAEADIVVADGGSTDGSTEALLLARKGVNTLLVKQGSGKLGSQMRMAFAWALRRGYQGVVVIDGNNKDSVEAIPNFIAALERGYDHVQGSRFIPGGYHENTPHSRLLGLKLLHMPLMRLGSGYRYTDTTNGFRAYSARLLRDPDIAVFRDVFEGYELHYYLACRAPRLGYRCLEIPVSRKYPATGKTPTKISPIRGSLQVIGKLVLTVLGYYNPRV